MIHETKQRTLIDWGYNLNVTNVQTIVAKEECEHHNHYHLKKTERFMMIQGPIECKIERDPWYKMKQFKPLKVNPGVTHRFKLGKGAIMICLVDKVELNDDH